jgi:hypothetical protein
LPQSNNASVSPSISTPPTGTNGTTRTIRCFRCRGNHHVRDCPNPAPAAGTNESGTRAPRPLADWKYIRPADLTQAYVDNHGRSWKFCTHCRCRATQCVGIYQLSHFDSEHRSPDPGPSGPDATPTPAVTAVVSHNLPTAPSGNLTQVNNPQAIPPGPPEITIRSDTVVLDDDDDPDAIEFQGMWCVPVVGHDEANVSVVVVPLEGEQVVNFLPISDNKSSAPTPPFNTIWFDCVEFCDFAAPVQEDLFFLDAYEQEPLDDEVVADQAPSLYLPCVFAPVRSVFLKWLFLALFWFSALFWDTMTYFVFAPPSPPSVRRVRRSSHKLTLRGFPTKWMILSTVMLHAWSYQGSIPVHPVMPMTQMTTYIRTEGLSTFTRIRCLDSMVDLSVDTFLQFQEIKRHRFYASLSTSSFGNQRKQTTPKESLSEDELDQFFDTLSVTPEPYTGEHFFDSTSWVDDPQSPDWFSFHDLCVQVISVDCRHNICHNFERHQRVSTQAHAYLSQFDTHASKLMQFGTERHPVIFDTGASLGITFNKMDFDGPLTKPEGDLRFGGMAKGLKIEGIGPVTWTFRNGNHEEVQIRSNCYYVPNAKVRLLSPQRLFNRERGVGGKFEGDESAFKLVFHNGPTLTVDYDEHNHLPIGYAIVGNQIPPIVNPQANVLILDDANQNLTAGQKLLLQWHYRFGHLNLRRVQSILCVFPFSAVKYSSASKCDISNLKCAICQYAKAHRRATHGTRTTVNPDRDGSLTAENLNPGKRVSVDHFECRQLGRTFDSYGKASSEQYKGGCIFVDHGSGYLHVEHQLGFSAIETIRAKQNFEKRALDCGVVIQSYLTDSRAFKANAFVDHIRNSGQRIQYCGTNAHHQNGVAERSIRTVSNMSRALILHAAAHWPQGIDGSLWPMAVSHSIHIYNNTPNQNGFCPADLFTGEMVPRHRLQDFHTWGCPVFILDPKLQSGQKLPQWQPRSRQGIYMGISTIHSSEVPLVLNPTTGSITPQFHVVFDDEFSTVTSIEREHDPPSFWNELCLENTVFIPVDYTTDGPSTHLADDWLTPEERILKQRELIRREEIRNRVVPPGATSRIPDTSNPTPVNDILSAPDPSITLESTTVSNPSTSLVSDSVPVVTATTTSASSDPSLRSTTATSLPASVAPPMICRSERFNKGQYGSTRYFDEVFLTPLAKISNCDDTTKRLAYMASLYTCHDTGLENISDPCMYAAKHRKDDPDSPTFHQAINGENAEDYIQAMKLEVETLVQQRTWMTIPRTPTKNVLKGTWVFKLKRLPDGTPLKFKARFCARGDLQQEGVDYFETYAPVVQWSTIRLLLLTVLTEGWATRQVDYTNAFAQAEIKEEVFLEFPRLFGPKSGSNVVLKLLKSLYGLKQAPRTFFEKLRAGLLERGYTQSLVDPFCS